MVNLPFLSIESFWAFEMKAARFVMRASLSGKETRRGEFGGWW